LILIASNAILLLNFVIALMSDTYSKLSEVKLGLYSQGIIEAIPSYKNDKYYGGLIVMIPPLNVIAFLLLPCYLGIGNKKHLEKFNKLVCWTIYLPYGIVMTIIFSVGALSLMPFAWIKVIVHKCMLAKKIK
jgi:hypothetical protein